MELIHAFSGSGNEIQRAMQVAEALEKSDPKSGYSQVLRAEMLSTWNLSQEGQPLVLRDQIIAMCDEALKLNPKLAQAHVAKARALVRSSMYNSADSSIDAALALDPSHSGAMFLRAEIFRRTGALAEADKWYRQFIYATPARARKSNGYFWLGWMYQDASWDDEKNRKAHLVKARAAYESMVAINPESAWGNVNFAGFLNDLTGDFGSAERYAQKALSIMDFPMARYHLAAARYQKLGENASPAQGPALAKAANEIAASTGVSLTDAIAFKPFSSVLRRRLQDLQSCFTQLQK